jgi:hypothetical protein
VRPDGFVNFALLVRYYAIQEGQVKLVGRVVFELQRQVAMRFFRSGEAEHSARFAVESVHNPQLTLVALQYPMQVVRAAKAVGYGQEPGGLVHHQEGLVGVYDRGFKPRHELKISFYKPSKRLSIEKSD